MSRRNDILEAAERLFEHYGVNKTTMQDIAGEADVGVGTVYLEFDSKRDIVSAIAAKRHDAIIEQLTEASQAGRTFGDRLTAFLDARYNAFVRYGKKSAHAHELVHCEHVGAGEAWKDFRQKERQLLRDMLEEAAAHGEIDVTEPRVACEAIFLIYATFSPPHLFTEDEHRLKVMKEVHHIVWQGLKPRS